MEIGCGVSFRRMFAAQGCKVLKVCGKLASLRNFYFLGLVGGWGMSLAGLEGAVFEKRDDHY